METAPKFLSYIASGFCAFKASPEVVTAAFLDWQRTILAPLGASLEVSQVTGTADDLIDAILPRVSPVRTKNIFIPCKDGWVLALDNGFRGTDASTAAVLSRKCGCPAVRSVSQSHTLSRDGHGSYGAQIFEAFETGISTRTIFCANDGGKWKFGQSGIPYSFEDAGLYTKKLVRERFSHETLKSVLDHLHIHAFDPMWCLAGENTFATVISRIGVFPEHYKEHNDPP
jgi:hypothetical protein